LTWSYPGLDSPFITTYVGSTQEKTWNKYKVATGEALFSLIDLPKRNNPVSRVANSYQMIVYQMRQKGHSGEGRLQQSPKRSSRAVRRLKDDRNSPAAAINPKLSSCAYAKAC